MTHCYIPFANRSIQYSCSMCGGRCCSIAGKLILGQTTKALMDKEYPHLSQMVEKRGEAFALHVPSVCWFLGRNGCLLGEQRPLSCKMYPFNAIAGPGDKVIVEYVPCPMEALVGNDGIEHADVAASIRSMIALYPNGTVYTYRNVLFAEMTHVCGNRVGWSARYDFEQSLRDMSLDVSFDLSEFLARQRMMSGLAPVSHRRWRIHSPDSAAITALIPQLRSLPPALGLSTDVICTEIESIVSSWVGYYRKFGSGIAKHRHAWVLAKNRFYARVLCHYYPRLADEARLISVGSDYRLLYGESNVGLNSDMGLLVRSFRDDWTLGDVLDALSVYEDEDRVRVANMVSTLPGIVFQQPI